MNRFVRLVAGMCLCVAAGARPAGAQIDARMFREPSVSATHIAFVYAGDIWVVPKAGGVAVRLSSPPGEESFPRFSPDGTRIAYTANYDGVDSVYVAPALGGEPVRLTHHPMGDRVVGWHPDGARVVFASSRESGRQRFSQFFLVKTTGGLPEKLPVPYGEFGTFSPDGKRFAYTPQSQDFRTWKRYRGGWAPDIWSFDLTSYAAKNLTNSDAVDSHPMFHGATLYFLSDRGAEMRQNLWALDEATGAIRRVTEFKDYDITFPSIGPSDLVFQAGGRLYRMDLATEKAVEVPVQVTTDQLTLRPRIAKVAPLIADAAVSPSAKRAVFEARGDVFSVPAEHGPIVNLTRTSGVAERGPRWSPDGKTLAYWSDRSGEYELIVRPADDTGSERTVTSLGPGFRYPVTWSPDSTRVVYIDQSMRIRLTDVKTGKTIEIDRSPRWISHGGLQGFRFVWSADARWIAWARSVGTENDALFLYDAKDGALHQATSGYFADTSPGGPPRSQGHADQRVERIRGGRVSVLLPGSRPRAAHRDPDLGRSHRDQRRAGSRGRRRRHRAHLPDVRPERHVVRRGPRCGPRHCCRRGSDGARAGQRSPARTSHRRGAEAARRGRTGAGEARLRAARPSDQLIMCGAGRVEGNVEQDFSPALSRAGLKPRATTDAWSVERDALI